MVPKRSTWWVFLLRGLFAIAFGVLTFFMPGMTLWAMVILFGAFAIVEGSLSLSAAMASIPADGPVPRGAFIFQGVVGVVAGLLSFLMPGLTAIALLYVIAGWAVASGLLAIIAAVRLRKRIKGEWALALSGVLAIVFGLSVALFPGAGALALALWIGAFSIAWGVLLIAVGVKVRKAAHGTSPTGGAATSEGMAAHGGA
jgi:uncharacterized membrane protein HdeD (DUF308 family)